MKLDILAIGVHPDDVELGCSGSLLIEINKGKKGRYIRPYAGRVGNEGRC